MSCPPVPLLLLVLALVLLLGSKMNPAAAFVPPTRPLLPRASASNLATALETRLHGSSAVPLKPTEKIRNGETPTATFGRPLDRATKEWNRSTVRQLKQILFDNLFAGATVERAYARFYALETIARMPYFSYLSVLHLLETLGSWRRADYLKIHFSQSWNEMHHLLIMEELGGNDRFADRFVAQHIAFFYYWIVVGLYLLNPTFAYNLNQAIEEEAYETYDSFLRANEDYLKDQPAALVAVEYYRDGDLYMFDEMHTAAAACSQDFRRPKIDNLHDVFVAIRDDEMEHVKTMVQMQESEEHDTCTLK